MNKVYLSRRNLLVLLSKLDRNKQEKGSSACTIVKADTLHPRFPCSTVTEVIAVENEEYYEDRDPGEMHPADNNAG